MTAYTILSTQPTVYNDPVNNIVNGVLIRFRMDAYNEVSEVRIPEMDAAQARAAIEKVVSQRDTLAGVSTSTKK